MFILVILALSITWYVINELDLASKEVALSINIGKTNFMTNLVASEIFLANNLHIEQVYSYRNLGHEIRLGRDDRTLEISGRIDFELDLKI